MPEHEIRWSETVADDGTVTVPLDPPPERAWRDAAKRLLAELRNTSHEWRGVRLKKGAFVVEEAGTLPPADVRFFLESVVLQANAATAAPAPAPAADDADAELAAAYRAFAGDGEDAAPNA